MRTFRQSFRLVGLYFKLNLSSALEYRASFFMSAFGMALSNSAFIFFWWIAFEQIGARIGGYDFRDVMFIWASASAAFGLSTVLFANMHRLSRLIVTGELDTFLLQPKEVLVSVLCARTDLSAWGDLAYGFVLMALTGQGTLGWVYFFVSMLIGGLLFTAVSVTFHTLSFYFGDASAIGSMVSEFMINFSIYPEGIYHGFARLMMMTILPAYFIVHVPLKLARGASAWWLLGLLLFAALYLGVAWHFFYRGLKKYESGNLILTRM